MKTRVDSLTTIPRPQKAANEDFVADPKQETRSGWDAYEVWRTRIKAFLDQPNRTQRPG